MRVDRRGADCLRNMACGLLCLGVLVLSACSTLPSVEARRQVADDLATGRQWVRTIIPAQSFTLLAYSPAPPVVAEVLTIYLEGDGLAWISVDTPSTDPTPRNPLALRLALAQPSGAVAYLARPCQFVGAGSANCQQRYWTDARFAPVVVDAMNDGVTQLKARFGASRLILVGYSGGGALATLLAARRSDVVRLVTVAGNLDHRAWTSLHQISPLQGSLNASAVSDQLRGVPQTHFFGSQDRIIPPELALVLPAALRGNENGQLRFMEGFGHQCCWVEHWAELWEQTRTPPQAPR